MKTGINCTVLLLSILWAGPDSGVLWLSQIPPPERANQVKSYGMHHLPALKSGYGTTTLVLWLRQGDSVVDAAYPDQPDFDKFDTRALSPSGEVINHKLDRVEGGMELTLDGSEEGFYNAYLIDCKVNNEALQIVTIQSELINHSCRNGHEHVSRNLGPFYGGDDIPLGIIRQRFRWEDFHTFIQSGDVVEYQLLLHGDPIPGVTVTLITHQGWQKSQVTDGDGKVSFEFIGEYFNHDKEFHRGDEYHYLLVADYAVNKSGKYQGQPYQRIEYQSSMSEKYRAATEIYTSSVWGLAVMLLTIGSIAVAVFVYRRKTSRGYREVVFSEKD